MSELIRSSGGKPQRAGGPVAGGPARFEWGAPVERLGWEVMPPVVQERLATRGIAGEGIASWADDAGVRRRGDAYAQYIEGWWADATRFVVIQIRRPLAPEGATGRRCRPAGAWDLTALVHQLDADTQTQRWRRPVASDGEPASPETNQSVLAILPSAVRDRIGQPTQWGACRRYPGNGLHERVVAYRRDGSQIVLLSAERRGGAFPEPETAIDSAPWITTWLEGRLGSQQRIGRPEPP